MSTSSPEKTDRARKNERAILRGLARIGQAAVAAELGVSESTVSRLKEGEIERFSRLLALCGLKAVPLEMRCYPPEHVDWLLLGNRIAAQRVRSLEDLTEDDPE